MAGESDFCRFFKIQDSDIKMRGKIPSKTLSICLKCFFRTSLRNFLCTQQIYFIYLEGVFNLPNSLEKRMKVIRHVDQNIFKKN